MAHYHYLIIGGGMTGDSAVRGIRQVDKEGSVGLISAEPHPPYNRPPLSKGLWSGKKEETIWRPLDGLEVDLHLQRRVIELQLEAKQVKDGRGELYGFDKLLLATGGSVIRLPFAEEDVLYFRTLADYRRLCRLAERKNRFAVIGGGFIGSEIAAALAGNGKEVVMLFPEKGIGGRMFPGDLAEQLNQYYREQGVEVRAGELLIGLDSREGRQILSTDRGSEIAVEAVVAGLGIRPNIELASQAGLKVNKGILVDAHLQSSHPEVFAAGDVAEFYNPALDTRMVVEHEENANMSGYLAGMAMAGQMQAYDQLPYFYSQLFDHYYEGIGEMTAEHRTVADWEEPFRKGVIYYLKENRLRGVLLWNIRRKINAARKLIAESGPFDVQELKGKIS